MVCLHEEGHARLNGMKFNCQFISMRFLFFIYFRLTSPNLHLISQEAVERIGVKGLTNVIGNNK